LQSILRECLKAHREDSPEIDEWRVGFVTEKTGIGLNKTEVERAMRFITAIIQPQRLEAVKRELEAVDLNLMTVTSVIGPARPKHIAGNRDGAGFMSAPVNKVRLDITISEDFVESTIEAIVKGAHIDDVGCDQIFVF